MTPRILAFLLSTKDLYLSFRERLAVIPMSLMRGLA
jgi:hypothetical protein